MDKDSSIDEPSSLYTSWAMHYSVLGVTDRKDPIQALMMITNMDSLFEVRRDLWELLLSVMYSRHNEDDDPETKGDTIFFFMCIHELFELAYRIRQLVEEKKLIYSYHHDKEG